MQTKEIFVKVKVPVNYDPDKVSRVTVRTANMDSQSQELEVLDMIESESQTPIEQVDAISIEGEICGSEMDEPIDVPMTEPVLTPEKVTSCTTDDIQKPKDEEK